MGEIHQAFGLGLWHIKAVIENFLIRKFHPIPSYDDLLIQKGFEIVNKCKGRTNVKPLSDCLYKTPKTLERKFSQYLGKSTKQVIKLLRFKEVLTDLSSVKDLSLTELAFNNGYFDLSHYIRDFKSYTGYTPKEFIEKYPDFNMDSETC